MNRKKYLFTVRISSITYTAVSLTQMTMSWAQVNWTWGLRYKAGVQSSMIYLYFRHLALKFNNNNVTEWQSKNTYSYRTVELWFYISFSLWPYHYRYCNFKSCNLQRRFFCALWVLYFFTSLQTSKLACFKFSAIWLTLLSDDEKFKTSEHICL
jgi:hypothetical protein